ncbi:MAG: AraC family transcriptional regulator [Clostridia bacterium]|nr:AraC family transcriptional regulator [Clostridia bacterium]
MQHNFLVNDEKRKDLNPVSFGYEKCAKGHSHGPTVRPYWLIHFVESGNGVFKIGNNQYSLSENELFVIPPEVETFYQADMNTPWSYTWIGFTAPCGLPADLPDILFVPEGRQIFEDMKKCTKFKNGRTSYLCARLWDLFAVISDAENSTIDYVDNALDCIHAEYMTNLTVEKIAARLNIDRTYFSTLFKSKIGLSPKQYLTRHRMHTAAALFKNNKLSVATVSSYVGYPDPFTFSKSFKRFFGVSPTQYVAKMIDNQPQI